MVQRFYLVGTLYDSNKESVPGEGHYDLIVYRTVDPNERRTIGSLEGVFVSHTDSVEIFGEAQNKPVRRDEIAEFARKYCGSFIPTVDGAVRFVPESVGEMAARVNNSKGEDVPFMVGDSPA